MSQHVPYETNGLPNLVHFTQPCCTSVQQGSIKKGIMFHLPTTWQEFSLGNVMSNNKLKRWGLGSSTFQVQNISLKFMRSEIRICELLMHWFHVSPDYHPWWGISTTCTIYHHVSNIRRTNFKHLKDSRTVSRLSLPNLLKPAVKSRMKM